MKTPLLLAAALIPASASAVRLAPVSMPARAPSAALAAPAASASIAAPAAAVVAAAPEAAAAPMAAASLRAAAVALAAGPKGAEAAAVNELFEGAAPTAKPISIPGPVFQNAVYHGSSYMQATKAMHDQKRNLAEDGYRVLKGKVFDKSNGDYAWIYKIDARPLAAGEAAQSFGPVFERFSAHGASYRDALVAMHEEKRAQAAKGRIVEAWEVLDLYPRDRDRKEKTFSYVVEHRARRADEAAELYGPVYRRAFLNEAGAKADAEAAMNAEVVQLVKQKKGVVSAELIDLSSGGDGIFSYRIELR